MNFKKQLSFYSCDIVKGVPSGLTEFIAPLQRAGLCVMTPQPTSLGFWTIYMESFGSNPNAAGLFTFLFICIFFVYMFFFCLQFFCLIILQDLQILPKSATIRNNLIQLRCNICNKCSIKDIWTDLLYHHQVQICLHFFCLHHHCGMRDKSLMFLSAIFKNLIFLCR